MQQIDLRAKEADMKNFDIEWHEYHPTGGQRQLYADVLGYHFEIVPVVWPGQSGPAYLAQYKEAEASNGETWPIGLNDRATEDEAKAAVDTWLAMQVQEVRATGIPQVVLGPVFELSGGLVYGQKFLEALRPHLTHWDAVKVLPAADEDGHTGLYLSSSATGQGIRVMSCSRAEHVAMSTGTIFELDDVTANEDSICTTYFHESEIASYAWSSGTAYLSSDRTTSARMYHDKASQPARSDMRPREILQAEPAPGSASPAPAGEVLDLLGLLSRLVEGEVGRHTLWVLSKGQGTETEDGKAWLEAAGAVSRLKAGV
jgi:hypothetical protein